ncbi:MAG: 50S ribosomal protein L17 [Bacteroidia bacterium]|nr:50S ribosomal protein L17 [Bacteroidia bacterium]MDW8302377.1 50S ribosomal protein L17 [Bacteroidia bacterium]
MRHGHKLNPLGRTRAHRSAMLSNMASSLILNKRIITTVAKAKELRRYLEPLVTKAKTDTTHSRRMVFSYLQNKKSVKELFSTIGPKVLNRPGGYLRILKMGFRAGDKADMAMIEFVDFNDLVDNKLKEAKAEKPRTKKTRRKKKKATAASASSGNTQTAAQ